MKTKLRLFLTAIIAITFLGSVSAANWYVKPNASGTGASWDDPCNISVIAGTPSGIADGDNVYISKGIYESSTSKTIANYISIFGGYPDNLTGTTLPTRDLVADSTILVPTSGGTERCLAINPANPPTLPSQKIVLDGLHFRGFTMATGNAGTALSITTSQSNIDIKNCSFKNNTSLNANGGAINMGNFAFDITVAFENCNFINNQATFSSANGYGGVAYFNNGSTAKTINFTNCNFKGNSAYGRGGALYFTSVITCHITDCVFNDNISTNTTDNYSNGNGACIYVAGGTASNTFNLTSTIITGSYGTAKGSVFWFNATPKNYLNLTNCSLIGNYAKRTTSARAAIDADNLTTNIDVVLNGTVLSNYNWSGGIKASNKADLIYLSTASSNATTTTFTNSIVNGTYFSTGNAYDAVSPSVLYTTTGFLDESSIALALSGDLKITDKIVLKKVFVSADAGAYTPTKIFDVKKLTGKAMTLNATIPTGYKLTVDGTDHSAGEKTITIPISASDPVITLAIDGTTGTKANGASKYKLSSTNGILSINGLNADEVVAIYNASGQLLNKQTNCQIFHITNASQWLCYRKN